MKREDVSKIFTGATEEQINAILDINSKDIGNAKAKTDTLNDQIATLNEQIKQRDADLTAMREKLTAAQADAGKLTEAQTALADLQAKYAADQKDWEAKQAAQAYEFAVKSKAGELKFSSNAAKNDFVRNAIEKGMKMDGDTILGFDDFMKKYKEADPSAFVPDEPEKPAPTITVPGKNTPPAGGTMTLMEAMQRANAGEKIDIGAIAR